MGRAADACLVGGAPNQHRCAVVAVCRCARAQRAPPPTHPLSKAHPHPPPQKRQQQQQQQTAARAATPSVLLLLALLLLAAAGTASAGSSASPAHSGGKGKTKKWCPQPNAAACGLATEAQYDALVTSLVDYFSFNDGDASFPFIGQGSATVGGTPGACDASIDAGPDVPSGSTINCDLLPNTVTLSAACPPGFTALQATCFSDANVPIQGGGETIERLPIMMQGTYLSEVNCQFSLVGLAPGISVRPYLYAVCTSYQPPATTTSKGVAAATRSAAAAAVGKRLAEDVRRG